MQQESENTSTTGASQEAERVDNSETAEGKAAGGMTASPGRLEGSDEPESDIISHRSTDNNSFGDDLGGGMGDGISGSSVQQSQ